jgi:peptidoglycan/xylan/chitin deacetylase (PgdA/CDA1 family)
MHSSRDLRPPGPLLSLVALLLVAPATADGQPVTTTPQRSIAVTIDDLPFQGQQPAIDAVRATNRKLVDRLLANRIPAIGFVNEQKLERPPGTVEPGLEAVLGIWLDAGLELGNHGYAHLDLHRVPLAEYQADVLRGERATRRLLAERDAPQGKAPRFFRHPFLHSGRSLATRDAFHAFLAAHGYQVAPVTVDNSEWIWSHAYRRALEAGNAEQVRRIATHYVPYMEQKVAYYESRSRALFDREVAQTLLIHVNQLAVDTLDALAAMLRARGYRFVTLAEALEDPAFASPDSWDGSAGISWLDRWALAAGKGGDFFAGEPRTPQWVLDVAGIESE